MEYISEVFVVEARRNPNDLSLGGCQGFSLIKQGTTMKRVILATALVLFSSIISAGELKLNTTYKDSNILKSNMFYKVTNEVSGERVSKKASVATFNLKNGRYSACAFLSKRYNKGVTLMGCRTFLINKHDRKITIKLNKVK